MCLQPLQVDVYCSIIGRIDVSYGIGFMIDHLLNVYF